MQRNGSLFDIMVGGSTWSSPLPYVRAASGPSPTGLHVFSRALRTLQAHGSVLTIHKYESIVPSISDGNMASLLDFFNAERCMPRMLQEMRSGRIPCRAVRQAPGLGCGDHQSDAATGIGRGHGGAVHELAALLRPLRHGRHGAPRGRQGHPQLPVRRGAPRGPGVLLTLQLPS